MGPSCLPTPRIHRDNRPLLDARNLTWTNTGTGKADANDEEGWTLLWDGNVLTVDAYANFFVSPTMPLCPADPTGSEYI